MEKQYDNRRGFLTKLSFGFLTMLGLPNPAKIKTDEAMVARARKAMAIALTAIDDEDITTTTYLVKTL